MKDFPVLETPRCILNRITDGDVPVLRQIFDDESTRKYLPELQSLARTDKGIQQMLTSFDLLREINEGVIWGVRLEDVMIGFVAIMDLSNNPTILYAMHPSYRSNGYMKECVAISVQYVLSRGLCSSVQTEVYNDNVVSIGLLQSIGFDVVRSSKRKTFFQTREHCT